jgi:O-antigen/teichoic acid export membrane protein
VKNWWYTTRWLLGSQFAARALGLLNNVLLARLLAPVSYGDFTQAMAIAGSLAPLADTGISAIITRHTLHAVPAHRRFWVRLSDCG